MRPNESFVGQPIRSLQTMLRVIAENDPQIPSVVPDGIYGRDTMRSVSAFQRSFGLPITGTVDQRTWDTIVVQYELALVEQIEAEALQDFAESGYTACLGIILCFQLGARLGEMVAIKWSDIEEEKPNHIHIQRMERKVHAQQPDGTWKCLGYEVVNHTKSEAGDRNTYLPRKARKILQNIQEWTEEHGF